MALNMNNASSAPAATANTQATAAPAGKGRFPTKEEIDGYINIYLPSVDGKYKKLGSLSLSLKDDSQKALTEWLMSDPTAVSALLPLLKIDFQLARNEGRQFDITKLKAQAAALTIAE